MRNVFSFTLAGALGLSAAVGATSFATVDFEEVSLPQVLSVLGFDFGSQNAAIEPEVPNIPSTNTVVRLNPTSTSISPFDDRFIGLGGSFPEFSSAIGLFKTDGETFGFASGLIDASLLGSGEVLAFGTRADGSSISQRLSGFGSGLSAFSAPSSFAGGLTSLALATSGAGPVAFDNLILCLDACESDEPVLTSVQSSPSPVPLPASALMLMAAVGGLGVMRARRKA